MKPIVIVAAPSAPGPALWLLLMLLLMPFFFWALFNTDKASDVRLLVGGYVAIGVVLFVVIIKAGL